MNDLQYHFQNRDPRAFTEGDRCELLNLIISKIPGSVEEMRPVLARYLSWRSLRQLNTEALKDIYEYDVSMMKEKYAEKFWVAIRAMLTELDRGGDRSALVAADQSPSKKIWIVMLLVALLVACMAAPVGCSDAPVRGGAAPAVDFSFMI